MAPISGGVWAIDIGNSSLKALRLSDVSGVVEVVGFDNIQHGKILTGSGVGEAERNELVALSLRQFVSQNDLGKDEIVVSVPSQNSFARFVVLPPVEPKRIPEIVKFEAVQQIPFDINDVQWDWQLMTETGSSENRVGIFAIKNDAVTSALEHFSRENIQVGYVQMASMALYNYALYDHPDLARSDDEATVILNIGAENTDLVVCTKSTVWQRCIPMGGNAFTKAIAEAFKLSFEKAEKLKRTAPMSKYARQILQAMKPVFADLASEIQRSLGFYNSSNQNTKLVKVIALGGGTKMRGLLKYLQQTLQIPVERPDSFRRLAISSDVSAAKFHESVCDFGVVYGLALQGLGLGRVESNLLPSSIARSMAWAGKAKYFITAACMVLLLSVLCLAKTFLDKANYNDKASVRQEIRNTVNASDQAIKKVKDQQSKGPNSEATILKEFELFNYRDVIPLLHQTIISALPNEKNNPEQKELYRVFAETQVEKVLKTLRKERKQIFVTSMSVRYTGDIEIASFSDTAFTKGRSKKKKKRGREDYAGPEEDLAEMMAAMGMDPSQAKYGRKAYTRAGQKATAVEKKEEVEEGGAGFVVTITGYSPYRNIRELIDPAGVEDDKSKWGFITRLQHLDDIVDGNSPFELYKQPEKGYYELQAKPVDIEADMPFGIGLEAVKFEKTKVAERTVGPARATRPARTARPVRGSREQSGEEVLIDPMTKEIISKVAQLDEDGKEKFDNRGEVIYEVNDHWFILDVKFIWKDAPKKVEDSNSV